MELKNVENELRRKMEALSKLKKLLRVYEISKDSIFRKKGLIADMKKLKDGVSIESFSKWLEEEEKKIREEEDIFRSEMGNQLLRKLSEKGFVVKGQFPVLRFGFYTLKLSFEKPRADLYWGPEAELLSANIPVSVDEILKEVEKAHYGIVKRGFNLQRFDEILFRGYKRLIYERNEGNKKVKVVELLKEVTFLTQSGAFAENPIKKNFKEYPRYLFSYDLYQLKRASGKWRFTVAPFDATTRKRDSLWIPDDEWGNGTYYAYIERSDG